MPDGTNAGLQAERTTMAWQRTALGIGGVSALLLHYAGGRAALSIPGAAGLLGALALLLAIEAHNVRAHHDAETACRPMGQGVMRAVSLAVTALALAAITMILGTGR